MKIVAISKYDFCSVCHLSGAHHMIEFKAMLPEENPSILLCKECCKTLDVLSENLED